jgi:peptidylprolyl isomerase
MVNRKQMQPPEVYTKGAKVRLDVSIGGITTTGSILLELRNDMPITTGNFLNLVRKGTYNNTIFYQVDAGHLIFGGQRMGTSLIDSSIPCIKDEFTGSNLNNQGTIAMMNEGPNTGRSRFFINLSDNNWLDTKHPVFGRVISGWDVVDAIGKVQTSSNNRLLPNKPIKDVKIMNMAIV